jgi:hypothetical protein
LHFEAVKIMGTAARTGRALGNLQPELMDGTQLDHWDCDPAGGRVRDQDVFDPVGSALSARSIRAVFGADDHCAYIGAVNVPFTVTVRTLGSSPCTRAADMDVVVSGLNVDITPRQSTPASPFCRDDLKAFEHGEA